MSNFSLVAIFYCTLIAFDRHSNLCSVFWLSLFRLYRKKQTMQPQMVTINAIAAAVTIIEYVSNS